MVNIKTFKRRSAEKLIALGRALLAAGPQPKPCWQEPTVEQVSALDAINDIRPLLSAGCWDGEVFTLVGVGGAFNMTRQAAAAMVTAGQINPDGSLTLLAIKYLCDLDFAGRQVSL